MNDTALTEFQRQRYARHLALPEIGDEGQLKLLHSRVLLVGVGGLGSVAGYYLVAAGVGTVGIMDGDVLEASNLQRQIVHTTADIGRPKIDSARRAFKALNPDVTICTYPKRLATENAAHILPNYDFVVDATDNFDSKFLIADVCHAARKPYSHAGILKYSGQTMTVIPGQTACYRCVFGTPPPAEERTAPQGPLGVLPGVIGSIQATEAIKFILGIGELLTNRLFVYDALAMKTRSVPVHRNASCLLCGATVTPAVSG